MEAPGGLGAGELWYFAYGSNLWPQRLRERLGSSRESRRARLDGYRLAFNKRGRDGTAKANIVPDPAGVVRGAVYRCSSADLETMDGHEGVGGGDYRRVWVRVRCGGGAPEEALTYVAGEAFIDDSLAPAEGYVGLILKGARHHALPERYIEELRRAARGRAGEGTPPRSS